LLFERQVGFVFVALVGFSYFAVAVDIVDTEIPTPLITCGKDN